MQELEMGHSDYVPQRRLGLFDFLCLGWNCVIGSGIFLTQGDIAKEVGRYGPLMFLVGGLCCLPVASCFAHLAQKFTGTGGSSLYARQAFGPRTGFVVGWVMWLSGLIGLATVSVGMAEFVHSEHPQLLAVGLISILAVINLLGTHSGAWSNNLLAIFKLCPLLLACLIGLVQLGPVQPLWPSMEPIANPDWRMGLLLVLFTYSGYEEISLPAGEAKNPEKTVPRATLLVLVSSALFYTALQGIVSAKHCAAAARPLEAAFPSLAGILAAAAIASLISVNASIAFTTPRSLWTLAHQGWMPAGLLRLSRGAPVYCVLISAALTVALVSSRNLQALIALSVLAATLQHLAASLACWKLGLGSRVAPLATVICLLLLCTCRAKDLGGMALSLGVGTIISYLMKPTPSSSGSEAEAGTEAETGFSRPS